MNIETCLLVKYKYLTTVNHKKHFIIAIFKNCPHPWKKCLRDSSGLPGHEDWIHVLSLLLRDLLQSLSQSWLFNCIFDIVRVNLGI